MASGDTREVLRHLIEERGEDYSSLSRLIGRNAAYVQQYIKRGTPRRLAEEDRRTLARYFGVPESLLGGSDERSVSHVVVPTLSVAASAGDGAYDGGERATAHIAFDPKWLRRLGTSDGKNLSIIEVQGDSMAPTLSDGDEILVDRGDSGRRVRDGIYVLRRNDTLMVKRLAVAPSGKSVEIRSDNPAYPSWPHCDLKTLDVVGRVVWCGRRLG